MAGLNNEKSKVTAKILNGLSISLAIMVTFVALPEAYARSVDWVAAYTASRYGEEFVELCRVLWFVILGATVFFGSYLSTYLLVAIGGMSLIMKII